MASTKETSSGVPQPAGMELAELNHRSASLGSWDVGIFNSGGRHPAAMTGDANVADRPPCVVDVDYYITKYVTKPMEQLQNLTTQYALGMRRLEEKEEREKATRLEAGGLTEPGC